MRVGLVRASVWCVCTTPFGSAVVPEVHSDARRVDRRPARDVGRAPFHAGWRACSSAAHHDQLAVEARAAHQRDVVGAAEPLRHRDDARAGLVAG